MSHDSCCGPAKQSGSSSALSAVFLSGADVLRVRSETHSSEGEVWHLATLRLPCWVVPSPQEQANGALPTQPICTFLIRLKPVEKGALLQTRSSTGASPDTPPAARDLVELLRDAMIKNSTRPEVVEFSDAIEADYCKRSLESLGVRTSIVPVHAGLMNYARETAIKSSQPRADGRPPLTLITPQGGEPGLRTGGSGVGMNDALIRAYYQRADALALTRPWERVAERQTLRIRIGGPDSEPIWAAIIGQEWVMRQEGLRRSGQNPGHAGPPRLGLTIFRKRADAEGRLMIPLAEQELAEIRARNKGVEPTPPFPAVPTAVQNPLDQICSACGASGADARCTGCADAYYCNEVCQREAFPKHAAACKSSPVQRPVLRQPWAASRGELTVLFVDPTRFPFADHSDLRALNMMPHSPMNYPMVLSFKGAIVARPNAEELKTVIRALAAVEAFVREFTEEAVTPLAMTAEVSLPLGSGRGGDTALLRAGLKEEASEQRWWDATGEGKGGGGPPVAHIRTDPLVTREEAKTFATRKSDAAKRMNEHAASLGAVLSGAYTAAAATSTLLDEEETSVCAGLCCRRRKI